MMTPAKTATLLRTKRCQISVHWPAAAFVWIRLPPFSGLSAGAVSASPSMKVCTVIR